MDRAAGLVHRDATEPHVHIPWRDALNRRPSPARRAAVITFLLLGVSAWLLAVVIWTAAGRVSSSSGFADVAIETIQSPPGSVAVADAVVAEAAAFARGQARDLTAASEGVIREQVGAVVADPGFSSLIAAALERAHQGFIDHPRDDITIDLSALRVPLAASLGAVDPALSQAIPPAQDLSVTIRPADLDPAVTGVTARVDVVPVLLVWLLIATVVFLGLSLLSTGGRARTARRAGLAFIAIGVLPLVLRLISPWIAGIAAGVGNRGDTARVAAVAIVGNWWIALLVTVTAGVLLLVVGIVLRGPRRLRSTPIMLGN